MVRSALSLFWRLCLSSRLLSLLGYRDFEQRSWSKSWVYLVFFFFLQVLKEEFESFIEMSKISVCLSLSLSPSLHLWSLGLVAEELNESKNNGFQITVTKTPLFPGIQTQTHNSPQLSQMIGWVRKGFSWAGSSSNANVDHILCLTEISAAVSSYWCTIGSQLRRWKGNATHLNNWHVTPVLTSK